MDHQVIQSLRATLTSARNERQLAQELTNRFEQLVAKMVDGRVIPTADAKALHVAIATFIRSEALPVLTKRDPDYALRLLNHLKIFNPVTKVDFATERPAVEQALRTKYPPPKAATWPIVEELRAFAVDSPGQCKLERPVESSAFVSSLKEEGGVLPDEMVSLYGACDGFELNTVSGLPVFALLGSSELDLSDSWPGYPRSVLAFFGGDDIEFGLYQKCSEWWCVYTHEGQPIGSLPFDVQGLIAFGMQLAKGADNTSASPWEAYFKFNPS